MRVIINKDIIGFDGELIKSETIIDTEQLSFNEKTFWKNRVLDGKKDGYVSEIKENIIINKKKSR